MESESTHEHLHHNPEKPFHESGQVAQMRNFFAQRKIEFFSLAQEFMMLSDEELNSIITECTDGIEKNNQYIENLKKSDYDSTEKRQHIYQAERAGYYWQRRKLAAETILEARTLKEY